MSIREPNYRALCETAKIGIFQLDLVGNCTYANSQMTGISELSNEQLLQSGWQTTVHPDDQRRIADQIQMLVNKHVPEISLDCSLALSGGNTRWVTGEISRMFGDDGQHLGFVGTISDISELKDAYDQLEQMAFYDELTKCANRRLFDNRLNHMLSYSAYRPKGVALLLIDLDHFKQINDTLGHDAGDALLKAVSERMKHCIRFTDTLARRGGDEFAVIMPNASDRELISIVASQLLRALAAPVYYQDHEMKISASIGIAMSFGDGIAAAALIKNADIALYKVKESGRNNFSFFETVKT